MSDIAMTASMLDVDKIYALVEELREVDRSKAIRYGLLRGAKVLAREGKRNLRLRNNEHTGNLMKSIRAKIVRRELRAYAGFEKSWKFQMEKGVGNHAHLVDRGTGRRFTEKGQYRGIMPASYFWSDVEAVVPEVRKAVEDGIIQWIEKLKSKYA